jgi:hypothetical protein
MVLVQPAPSQPSAPSGACVLRCASSRQQPSQTGRQIQGALFNPSREQIGLFCRHQRPHDQAPVGVPIGGYTRLPLVVRSHPVAGPGGPFVPVPAEDVLSRPPAGRAWGGPFWQAGPAQDYLGACPCHPRDCVRGRRITAAQGAGSTACRQGERFQQTLKNWLAAQSSQPADLNQLQALLETFTS